VPESVLTSTNFIAELLAAIFAPAAASSP